MPAALQAGLALATQAQLLAGRYAARDIDFEVALAPQRDFALRAVVGVVQADFEHGRDVFAARAEALAASALPAHVGEQVGKKVLGAAAFEAAAPVRRRAELLAGAVLAAAQGIIGGALLRIAQHAVGFVQLLGARVGIGFLADVRMVLADQLAVSLLDFLIAGGLGDTQCCVVILVFHAMPSRYRRA